MIYFVRVGAQHVAQIGVRDFLQFASKYDKFNRLAELRHLIRGQHVMFEANENASIIFRFFR